VLQGTLLRTAAALGWQGAFLLPGCCDAFNDKALRAGRCASFQLPYATGSWEQLLQIVAAHQLTCLAAQLPERSGEQLWSCCWVQREVR
jgi:RNA methyltransferase, TrmH family